MLYKDDFIDRLSKKGYTKVDSAVIIDDFIRTLEEVLVEGESVMFRGFGTFEVRNRAKRECVCPSTKELVEAPAYRTPFFSPGKALKRWVNRGEITE